MIREHVKKAIKYNVNGVYCNPYWVPLVAELLDGTDIETGLVPDFPFGAATTSMKIKELEEMCKVVNGRPVKAIMENASLTDEEIAIGCQYVTEAGADWVKCATGCAASPRMETIKIMRENIPDNVKIKFAGYGTYGLTQLTIMGLATGAELFRTGYAHDIIEEIDRNYKDLVITTK